MAESYYLRDGNRSMRSGSREVYAVSVDGGPGTRVTCWGDLYAMARGWVSDDELVALGRTGQHTSRKTGRSPCHCADPAADRAG